MVSTSKFTKSPGWRSPRGDGQRMADQQHVEIRAFDGVDGQRGAVERHGTLGRHEFRQMLRRAQANAHRLAFRFHRKDFRPAIDMAGNDVAAKLIADLERPLQIDVGALCQPAIVVRRSASSRASTSYQRSLLPSSGSLVTVRQTPPWEIDAPISMVLGS